MNKLEKEDHIPCINCISLPICLANLNRRNVLTFLFRIKDRCPEAYEYLFIRNSLCYDRLTKMINYLSNKKKRKRSK
jgi:hypothetical protein